MTEISEERIDKYKRKLDRFDRRVDFLEERTDSDLCVVAPELKPSDTASLVWRKPELQAEELDVLGFQEPSLKAKHNDIRDQKVLWKRDSFRLREFMHKYRKLWRDTSKARGVT